MHGANGNNAAVARGAGGNVYAGANGNVYKHSMDGWSKWNNGGWNQVQKPANRTTPSGQYHPESGQGFSSAQESSQLERDRTARTQGFAQQRQFTPGGGGWAGRERGEGGGRFRR